MQDGNRFTMELPTQVNFPNQDPRVGDTVTFIITDTATGVEYLCIHSSSGMAMTPLINKYGEPTISK